jgi:adenine phosphoribosyltransferase
MDGSPLDLPARCSALVRDVPDYPNDGVLFKDITPLIADGVTFGDVVRHIADHTHGSIDFIAGMEARGFILGAPVAFALGAGFLAVRKAGKLPGPTFSSSYDLEYGSATVEIQTSTIKPGDRILIVDDVLATGGTAAATVELLESAGAEVVGLSFLLELDFLHGRDRLPGRRVDTLLHVS